MDEIIFKELEEYQNFVGKYISFTCKLENFCHVFIIDHFVDYDDKKTEQFVGYFLSKQEITFSTILNMFHDLIITDPKYKNHRDSDIITRNNIKRIIKYRNILAHASFNGTVDDKYEFLWLNKEYKKESYILSIDKSEFDTAYNTLISVANKVVQIATPIIKREEVRHFF